MKNSTIQCMSLAAILCVPALATHAQPRVETLYAESFDRYEESLPASRYDWKHFALNCRLNRGGTTLKPGSHNNRALFFNINSRTASSNWSAGVYYAYNTKLPAVDLANISLRADVSGGGSEGAVGDVLLRIESSSGNWVGFTVDGATLAANPDMTLGGALATANASAGSFDLGAPSFNIAVVMHKPSSTWGQDSSNVVFIDNVKLEVAR